MSALPILLTNVGWAAFTAAQLDEDIDLTIAEIGFTADTFVMAPTLTALPGEFKRLDTLSGEVVGQDVVHLTVTDSSADAYEMRGFGLFLSDGTLFAVYGQAGAIVEKAAVSAVLFALDIKFLPDLVDEIVFGNADFLYPPATETVKGVAEIATQAEVDAGTDDERFVTPLKLAARLAALLVGIAIDLAAKAAKIITITGGGLVTGGGDLSANRTLTVTAASAAEADAGALTTKALTPASLVNILASIVAKAAKTITITAAGLAIGGGDLTANRTITVPKASAADAQAGTDDTKALTTLSAWGFIRSLVASGYVQIPFTPVILQWGSGTSAANGTASLTLPMTFPNACLFAIAQGGDPDPGASHNGPWVSAKAAGSITVYSSLDTGVATAFFAVGY